jgi:hypothetical protein
VIARSAEREPPPGVELAQPATGLFGAPAVRRGGKGQEPASSVFGFPLGHPLGQGGGRPPASGRQQQQSFVYERILVDAQAASTLQGILGAPYLIRLKRLASRALEHRLALFREPDRLVRESEPEPGEQSGSGDGAAYEGGPHVGRV